MSTLQKFIWCDSCDTVRPLAVDAMFGKDAQGKGFINPTDLMCGTCRLVIATTWDESFAALGESQEK
jgi:hypothetical protein